jgi:hypothetical protein
MAKSFSQKAGAGKQFTEALVWLNELLSTCRQLCGWLRLPAVDVSPSNIAFLD